MKKDKLYFLSFLAIVLVVFVIGYWSTNYLIQYSSTQLLKNQIESNKREAREMAKMVETQLAHGIDKNLVKENMQISIENTDTNIGFLCMFNKYGTEVCHPNKNVIGLTVKPNDSYITGLDKNYSPEDFYQFLNDQKEGGGVRSFTTFDNKQTSEIIYAYPVKNSDWIVASHANISKINQELNTMKVAFIGVNIISGVLIVLLSLFMFRLISGSYERGLENKNEQLSKEVVNLTKLNQNLSLYKSKVSEKETPSSTGEKDTTHKKRILTYHKNQLIPLNVENIAYLYTDNTITYIVCLDGKTSHSNSSLNEIHKGLSETLFFRANRQFILSIKAIDKILRYGNNQLKIEVSPLSKTDIIISKNKTAEFREWLNH